MKDLGVRPPCPKCDSTHVSSEGPRWKCNDCGRAWEKHSHPNYEGIWTKEEITILKKHWPQLGAKIQQFLPIRTRGAITQKACDLRINFTPTGFNGKAGYFDIETTGLQADFGYMLGWCIKTAGQNEIKTAWITPEEIHNGTIDKRIIRELIEVLPEYKRIYSYYGTNFDIKFARTRALTHNLPFIPYGLVETRDLYYLVKRLFRIYSKRLANACDVLDIRGKTHLSPKIWIQASTGNQQALDYIKTHCIHDVTILEKLHKKLMDYEAQTRRYI